MKTFNLILPRLDGLAQSTENIYSANAWEHRCKRSKQSITWQLHYGMTMKQQ